MIDHIYFDLDLTTQKPKIQDAVAEIFAEGCKELKQLLLYLWRNGVHTTSCCSGHDVFVNGKKEHHNGCVGIASKSLTKSQMKDFIAKLYLLNTTENCSHFGMQQGISIYHFKVYKKDINSFGISVKNKAQFKDLLKLFKSVIEREKIADFCARLNITTKLNKDIKHFMEVSAKAKDIDYNKYLAHNPEIESVDISLACNATNQLFNHICLNNGKNLLIGDEFNYEEVLKQINKFE